MEPEAVLPPENQEARPEATAVGVLSVSGQWLEAMAELQTKVSRIEEGLERYRRLSDEARRRAAEAVREECRRELERMVGERSAALEALRESQRELERRVEERTRQVRRLAERAATAQERERRAIAHDLHDGLGQVLFAATLKLDAIAKGVRPGARNRQAILDLRETMAEARRMLRSITGQLSPLAIETFGLVRALSGLVDEMKNTYGMTVRLLQDGVLPEPNHSVAALIYRAVRELLINVVKHAGIREATVSLFNENGQPRIRVEDRGRGIQDVDALLESTRTFGLRGIVELLGSFGGRMEISTRPGEGTAVTLVMPGTFGGGEGAP
jgi:signal transduction histidine kinase